jgi:hypothetical protein
MPGFNPQQLQYKALNANACVVLVGDQPLAFAQTTSHTFAFGTEALYGVGNAKPQEIQQLRISPEISLDNFALTELGNTLIQGGVTFASIIANNQFAISVIDGIDNIVLFTYVGCVARNFSETVAANRPITDAISFDAMDVLDQSGQSILNGPNAFTLSGAGASTVNGGLGVTVTASL